MQVSVLTLQLLGTPEVSKICSANAGKRRTQGWDGLTGRRADLIFTLRYILGKRCQIAPKIFTFQMTQTEPWFPFLSVLRWFLVIAGEALRSPGIYVTPIWGN